MSLLCIMWPGNIFSLNLALVPKTLLTTELDYTKQLMHLHTQFKLPYNRVCWRAFMMALHFWSLIDSPPVPLFLSKCVNQLTSESAKAFQSFIQPLRQTSNLDPVRLLVAYDPVRSACLTLPVRHSKIYKRVSTNRSTLLSGELCFDLHIYYT
jgi:hypothetical protein